MIAMYSAVLSRISARQELIKQILEDSRATLIQIEQDLIKAGVRVEAEVRILDTPFRLSYGRVGSSGYRIYIYRPSGSHARINDFRPDQWAMAIRLLPNLLEVIYSEQDSQLQLGWSLERDTRANRNKALPPRGSHVEDSIEYEDPEGPAY